MAGDGDQTMNYESYILPHLLPEVRPREARDDPLRDDPDEQFFIRTHQAFEIWFAQILAELDYARLLLSQPPPNPTFRTPSNMCAARPRFSIWCAATCPCWRR